MTDTTETKTYTIDELFSDIYQKFEKLAETQVNLSIMLKTWYLKLDVFSRVIQKLATRIDIDEEEFKAIAAECFLEIKEEIAKEETPSEVALAVQNKIMN